MVKYLICGGGISGLYSALLLLDKKLANGTDIEIVEKSYRLGGRIMTIEKEGITFEAGAGRFSDNHTILINLINRYGLKDKIIPVSDLKQYRLVLNDSIILPNSEQIKELTNKLISLELDESMRYKTLAQLCVELFGMEIAELYITCFGYDDHFYTRNAYDGLISIKTQFHPKTNYNILTCGLTQIVDNIKKELEESGVKITLNLKLVDWNETIAHFIDFNGKKINIEYSKLILAIDKHGLVEFSNLKNKYENILNSVTPISKMRIYAKFPLDPNMKMAWFHGIHKTSTNNLIRTFIPINEKTGLCVISYSDYIVSKKWQDLSILGELESTLMKNIREMYPDKKIPDPEWISNHFWHNGVYYYIPYVNSDHIREQIIQPYDNIYICGECYSDTQGWIEGALRTSIQVVDLISNNTNKNEKVYSIDEVNKSKNLTIIDGKVYDLLKSDWINKHPGGNIIKMAIGKDATIMFNYINHPKYAKDILEDLYIGIVKN